MTTANLTLTDPTPFLDALVRMNDVAPCDWWQYVGCSLCNAPRQEPCQAAFGPARGPHARRYRAGLTLHSTLWLLSNGFVGDVIGEDQ